MITTRNAPRSPGANRAIKPSNKALVSSTDWILIAAYAVALVAIALSTPLRVSEVVAIAWLRQYTWGWFWTWSSRAVDPSPLGYFSQLPFVLLFGTSRLAPRIPAILFAAGSCVLFLKLTRRAVPRRPYAALILFMLFPIQLLTATATTQNEAGTFFVILATIAFFDLAGRPEYKTAALFTLATIACLFTDHHAVLPVYGAVLFLLRFSAQPLERKAVWFALGACALAAGCYAPYYVWAHSQASAVWPPEPRLPLDALTEMTAIDAALAVSVLLVLVGVIAGAVMSFRIPLAQVTRRLTLFCVFGSVLATLAFLVAISLYTVSAIPTRDLLYAAPAAMILFIAPLDWMAENRLLRIPATIVGVAVLVIFGLADVRFLIAPKQDLALESKYIGPELNADSCIVFVSENYSKSMFLVFQPELDGRECQNFFHHRVVLASHPDVSPEQQADAEGYFQGLNYKEVKRIRSGGGQIVVMEGK